jgi:hypothetical protein
MLMFQLLLDGLSVQSNLYYVLYSAATVESVT